MSNSTPKPPPPPLPKEMEGVIKFAGTKNPTVGRIMVPDGWRAWVSLTTRDRSRSYNRRVWSVFFTKDDGKGPPNSGTGTWRGGKQY